MRVIPPVTENGVGAGVKYDDTVKQYGSSCAGWQVGMTRHVSSVESVCCCSLKTSSQMCRTMSHIECKNVTKPKWLASRSVKLVWESKKLSEVKDVNLYITGCTGSITFSVCLHDILMTTFLKLLNIKLTLVHSQSFCCKHCWIQDNLTMLDYIWDVAEELTV